jgi:hypothetical protein
VGVEVTSCCKERQKGSNLVVSLVHCNNPAIDICSNGARFTCNLMPIEQMLVGIQVQNQ